MDVPAGTQSGTELRLQGPRRAAAARQRTRRPARDRDRGRPREAIEAERDLLKQLNEVAGRRCCRRAAAGPVRSAARHLQLSAPMRWLELTVEVDSEAVEAVSEILGRAGPGRRGASHAADPRSGGRAGGPRGSDRPVRDDRPPARRRGRAAPPSSRQSARCGTSRRSGCVRWASCACGRSRTRTGPRPGRRGYAPQRIGRLVIVPSWLEPPIGPDAVGPAPGPRHGLRHRPASDDARPAWLLQGVWPMPARVLDVGCGSGILGLAALRAGRRADGRCARHRSGGGGGDRCQRGGQRSRRPADAPARARCRRRHVPSHIRWCSPTWWPPC